MNYLSLDKGQGRPQGKGRVAGRDEGAYISSPVAQLVRALH
ncbi:hypothetical protein [Sphingobacterium sp. FBM7-1]|nr:hypothetical protein [Sphingobacterium sp. FBM7-1]